MKKKTVEKKRDRQNNVKKLIFAGLAILLQVAWFYLFLFRLNRRYYWLGQFSELVAALLVLYIYCRHTNAAIKMPWIILITTFPLFGAFLYLFLGLNAGTINMQRRYAQIDAKLLPLLPPGEAALQTLLNANPGVGNQCRYIRRCAGYPVYQGDCVTFYNDAARAYQAQLAEVAKAEKFIFMEYFAVEDSEAFRPMRALLRQKAAEGVEVRIFYDYMGSVGFLNDHFAAELEADGVKCRVFNPVNPVMNLFINHRDHRKITVVDGKVGFTGGYNLADEYFHVTQPYGYWLDTGVRLTGEAVQSLTVTFLENWNAIHKDDRDDVDFSPYLPAPAPAPGPGFVQPYADRPMDEEQVGENVYINLLRNAKRYAYFMTPYLIITDEMNHAFSLAAKSGVDVRIITPGIPDKKMVYSVTRSYYARLARSGVRIFEFAPGFCHAKQCVCDDEVALCGTINLDFRSLYHHFENGVLMYDCQAVRDIKAQFEEVFPQCHEVTQEYAEGRSGILRLGQALLRLVAPLM